MPMSNKTSCEQNEKQLDIFKRFVEMSGQALGMADLEGRVFFVNSSMCRLLGEATPEDAYRNAFYAYYLPGSLKRLKEEVLPQVRKNGQWTGELGLLGKHAHDTPVIQNIFLIRTEENEPFCFATIITDIAQRTAELEKSNALLSHLQAIFENTSDLVATAYPNGQVFYLNAAGRRMLGLPADEDLRGFSMAAAHPAWVRTIMEEAGIPTAIAQGIWEGETAVVNRDGTEIPVSQVIMTHRSSSGEIDYISTIMRDISERKRTEDALRDREEHLRAIFENADEIIHLIAWDGTFLYISPSWERYTGFPVSETVGKSFVPYVHPDDQAACLEVVRKVYETGQPHKIMEFRVKHASGKWIRFMNSGTAIKDAQGSPLYFSGVATDITERKLAEEDLLAWMRRYNLIIQASGQVVYEYHVPSGDITWGSSIERVIGYRADEMRGGFSQWEELVHPDDRQDTLATLQTAEKACSFWQAQYRMRHKHGHYVWIKDKGFFLPDANGKVHTQLGMLEDITGFKHLEEQLLQSQKMEAVGQLAGGVAHDFNNLLQAILGYLELALTDMQPTDVHYAHLFEVRRAGERAATLTRQLLAFSRRQVLQLASLDINQVVAELLEMLKRLIGEDIELTFAPCVSPYRVKADRGQIEQVLTNLCVNARDAMPGGGRLLVETANIMADETFTGEHAWARPGRYFCISITDTGCGMGRETQQQIFEPFFTTKEKHKGTGLGLAMVYGIIRQHEGMIQVYSEVDQGTSFKIYLPAEAGGTEDEHAQREQVPAVGGTETILLAEDEELLRNLAEKILTNAGYRVLPTSDGQEALNVCQAHADEITLLFLDVIMPKLGGRAVYDTIKAVNPGIKCLFASGYSQDKLHTDYVLEEGLHLLQKPYTRGALLRLIRQILDEK